jgi:hypothetical protein
MELVIFVLIFLFLGCGHLVISIFALINLKRKRDEAERRIFRGIAESVAFGLGGKSAAYNIRCTESIN